MGEYESFFLNRNYKLKFYHTQKCFWTYLHSLNIKGYVETYCKLIFSYSFQNLYSTFLYFVRGNLFS